MSREAREVSKMKMQDLYELGVEVAKGRKGSLQGSILRCNII